MRHAHFRPSHLAASLLLVPTAILLVAALIPTTIRDFHLPGTQVGDIEQGRLMQTTACYYCHGGFDFANEPYATWEGSLMGQAGRDPLFYAQMATANQDVNDVGYFCMRCHVPMSFVTGHAYQSDGSTLDDMDKEGVSCHFCHSMVDPIYRPGVSPPEDEAILANMAEVPSYYGNAMFVLDPLGTRRGPYADAMAPHAFIQSDFVRRGDMCGTCHDVGNVCVTRQTDGTYQYNPLDEPTPTENLHGQFPLERTYTEWKLSEFASVGVDMGGRFGGVGSPVMQSCQDCHMPKQPARGCIFGDIRDDLHRHDFAGAAAQVLDLIAAYTQDDPNVDPAAIAAGRTKAVSMLERAASLELEQRHTALRVRVINETGHKLPTGHIEGRRVWINVQCFDAQGALVREYGHYDDAEAELDEASTRIYEMHVGLSPAAAQLTGYPAGATTHMALADTIEKDNRIPPRGFANAAYEEAGAPVVGASYVDGQYWDDVPFAIPAGATRAVATLYYQNTPRHYIEALRDGNHTNDWGDRLHDLWTTTGRGAPIEMISAELVLAPFRRGDLNCDAATDNGDIDAFVLALLDAEQYAAAYPNCAIGNADINGDGAVDNGDIDAFVACLLSGCP